MKALPHVRLHHLCGMLLISFITICSSSSVLMDSILMILHVHVYMCGGGKRKEVSLSISWCQTSRREEQQSKSAFNNQSKISERATHLILASRLVDLWLIFHILAPFWPLALSPFCRANHKQTNKQMNKQTNNNNNHHHHHHQQQQQQQQLLLSILR